jgi:hypothetical protein
MLVEMGVVRFCPNASELPRIHPLETVWKIGMGPERGVPKANERVETVPIGRFLAPKKHGREAFGYFPNSFSRYLGENKGKKQGRSPEYSRLRPHQERLAAFSAYLNS